MKITTLLLFVACMQVSAKSDAQGITLSLKNTTVERVFKEIRIQSGYSFIYNNTLLKEAGKVDVVAKNESVENVLTKMLRNLPFTFRILKKIIVVEPKCDFGIKEILKTKLQTIEDTIKGRVRNTSGLALSFVTVQVKGTSIATFTDDNGSFVIGVPSGKKVLIFSIIGYRRREIEIHNPMQPLNVVLAKELRPLDSVVVTGYTEQKRRAITGSIVSVEGSEIENIPLQSFDKLLQGRAAGVLVESTSGVPGGAVRINIRGIGSINAGTEPMYIVDGVQLNTRQPGNRTSANALAYINPNDIESIEILKDAAAAAIYGSQAANGVVLITTKKGKSGKTVFSINYYEGISAGIKNMEMLNTQDAISLREEALINNDPKLSTSAALAQALIDFGIRPDLTDDEIKDLPTYDWQSEAFKPGSVRNIGFSASGGKKQSSFYISGSYNKHDGNVTNLDFERGSFRLNVSQKVHPRLTLDAGINLSMIKQNGNTGSWGNTNGSAAPQRTAAYMPPSLPIYNADGSFNTYPGMPGTGFNPIQAATVDDNITKQRSLIGNFSASYKILNNLTFKSFYGIDYRHVKSDYYRDPRTPNGATWNGYLINDNIENVNFTTNQTLNFNTVINSNHNITALIGGEYRSNVRDYQSARANNFPTFQFRTNQSAAEPYSVTGAWSGSRRLGFFGQVNYGYQKKIFVSAVARYDGSSRFGVNNRFGFFPGISAGWDLAQEKFLSGESWISQLKIRVGYGVVGNDQINNVSSRGFYQGGTRYNNNAALRLQTLANPELGWERNISTNIGLDFRVLGNRINGTIDLYHRDSRNLLLNKPLPWTSGFSNVDDNLGRVINKGIEISLNTTNLELGNFKWMSNFNISFLKNEVVELYGGLDHIANTVRVGYPLKIWYRPRYVGVNSANGRPMWYDKNGNITYSTSADDNLPTEKGWQSAYFGGFTNTFSYKGFELDALFSFDMGRYMDNTMYQVWYNVMSSPGRNTLQELYDDRWTTPGQITYVARPISGSAEQNSSARNSTSTQFLQDASFIRLRNVTLSYTFQSNILNKLKVSRARLYLTAVNLYTWTKWIGYDPEFAVYGDVSNNTGIVPQTQSFTAGVQIGF